ncbi:ribonuclease P protein component [Marinibacterium sp. SX1]|uniref:ribonuclease P protein component n=1 Tax=Marinibacterium sp. SX1 TaxID=3388424 RepID=UPI003D184F64
MTAPRPDDLSGSGAAPAAKLIVLTQRADFLRAARARRQATPSFLLQARRRSPDETGPDDARAHSPRAGDSGDAEAAMQDIRVGFTCSKKVGNAVARNRAKRRLREIARLVLAREGHAGWDYVLIGKAGDTAARPFDLLLADLSDALRRIHAPRPARPRAGKAPRDGRDREDRSPDHPPAGPATDTSPPGRG